MVAKGMKVRAGKLYGKALAVLLAIVMCASAGSLPCIWGQGSFESGVGSAFAADGAKASAGDNSWQIVSGKYDAKYATSQGLSNSELAAHNFAASDDGTDGSQVHVTKTVEPTETEDEFIVHLSVDTSATYKQVTDYKSFFENAPYKATTSNGYHGYTAGVVTKDAMGNFGVDVSGSTQYGKKGTFDIYDPQGRKIVQNLTLYWSQSNNVTILLNIGEMLGLGYNEYVLMGIEVGQGNHNDLYLSQEAYDLISKAIQSNAKWGDPTELTSVTDVMGDNVEYIGDVTADGGMANFDDASRTLTWNPAYNSTYTTVEEDPVVSTEYSDDGAVAKVTVTQRKWLYGAASLTYKVRLNTQVANFESSYNADAVTGSCFTNNKATLSYRYSVDGGATYTDNTVDFPKPAVKGILYDLQVLKINEVKTPLAGATFKLTRKWTDSLGVAHSDVISSSLVSDADGYVKVDSLPWGTYTLEETTAPSGHTLPDEAKVTFELCYTGNPDVLTDSTIVAGVNHAMQKGSTQTVVNERVKTDVALLKVDAADTSKTVSGAKFALYKDSGDGSFNEADDIIEVNKVAESETSSGGIAVFEKLPKGTYYLKEAYTPAGYELNSEVYRIEVYDVKGAAGGADENMIRVGDADGSNMQAPNTANQIMVADRPIPGLPVTAGPGARGIIGCGVGLFAAGALCVAFYELHLRRRIGSARHRIG